MAGASTPGLSQSGLLRAKLRLFSGSLDEAVASFWTHRRFPDAYRRFLFESYHVVQATVPLLELARARCLSPEHRSSPISQEFAAYLAIHAVEETGHHEWILEDAAVLGIDAGEIRNYIPSAPVRHLVGSQYFNLHFGDPAAFIGYIAVLEGTPPELNALQETAEVYGMPIEAFSNLVRHARLDPRHRDDLDELIDRLPLTDDNLRRIGVNAIQTIDYLRQIMEGLCQEFPR
jgi:hypothetical protein